MVKLAKKHSKTFEHMQINLPKGLSFKKSGTVNIENEFKLNGDLKDVKQFQLLYALYAISDDKNCLKTNHELQLAAIRLFITNIDSLGNVDLDRVKRDYLFFKGALDAIWEMKKFEHRKAKRFGDPPYPKFDDALQAFTELEEKGLLNTASGQLNISKHDMAVMKQQLQREGFNMDWLNQK